MQVGNLRWMGQAFFDASYTQGRKLSSNRERSDLHAGVSYQTEEVFDTRTVDVSVRCLRTNYLLGTEINE